MHDGAVQFCHALRDSRAGHWSLAMHAVFVRVVGKHTVQCCLCDCSAVLLFRCSKLLSAVVFV